LGGPPPPGGGAPPALYKLRKEWDCGNDDDGGAADDDEEEEEDDAPPAGRSRKLSIQSETESARDRAPTAMSARYCCIDAGASGAPPAPRTVSLARTHHGDDDGIIIEEPMPFMGWRSGMAGRWNIVAGVCAAPKLPAVDGAVAVAAALVLGSTLAFMRNEPSPLLATKSTAAALGCVRS